MYRRHGPPHRPWMVQLGRVRFDDRHVIVDGRALASFGGRRGGFSGGHGGRGRGGRLNRKTGSVRRRTAADGIEGDGRKVAAANMSTGRMTPRLLEMTA